MNNINSDLIKLLLLIFIITETLSSIAQAEVVLQIGSDSQVADGVAVNAGQQLHIEVWASAAFPGATLSGYQLAFDLDSYGLGHSENFTRMTAFFQGGLIPSGTSIYANPNMVGHDLLVSASAFQPVPFPNDFSKLLTITVEVAANAQPGVYDLHWRSNELASFGGSPANLLIGDAIDGDQITATGLTSFRVTAVPEPSSFAVLLLGVGAVAYRKRRQQFIATRSALQRK